MKNSTAQKRTIRSILRQIFRTITKNWHAFIVQQYQLRKWLNLEEIFQKHIIHRSNQNFMQITKIYWGVGGGGGGRKIMAINTNIGRTSKSHKRLKNLILFLSEIIGLQYSLLNSRFPCFEIKTNVYVNVYVYISVW